SYILFYIFCFFFFFFFQAEDGIRDFHVTGVQTCALPIWWRVIVCHACATRHPVHCCSTTAASSAFRHSNGTPRPSGSWDWFRVRSEERRVGKECRCGGGGLE